MSAYGVGIISSETPRRCGLLARSRSCSSSTRSLRSACFVTSYRVRLSTFRRKREEELDEPRLIEAANDFFDCLLTAFPVLEDLVEALPTHPNSVREACSGLSACCVSWPASSTSCGKTSTPTMKSRSSLRTARAAHDGPGRSRQPVAHHRRKAGLARRCDRAYGSGAEAEDPHRGNRELVRTPTCGTVSGRTR